MNFFRYYFDNFYYQYINYPLVIKIAILLIIFYSILCFTLILNTLINYFKEQKKTRKSENDNCYIELENLVTSRVLITHDHLIKKNIKSICYKNETDIIDTLLKIKNNNLTQFNYENSNSLVHFFNLNDFWNTKLSSNSSTLKEKMEALQNIITLNANISEAVLSSLVYHNNDVLRKRARVAQIHLSKHDPFRFFEEEFDKNFTEWDKIKIHNILLHRNVKNIPNFAHWIPKTNNEDLKCLFIFEIGFYQQIENKDLLISMFKHSTSDKIKIQILDTLKLLKVEYYNKELTQEYFSSSVAVKLKLIKTLNTLEKPVKLLSFFIQSFEKAYNTDLKITIGKVIFNCGSKGEKIINELEKKANKEFEHLIFEHIKNPLITD